MNDLRTAAQQALEALCCVRDMVAHPDNLEFIDKHAAALRAALAEPRPIHECYGDCPTNPQTCPNPCNFEGRPRPVQEPVAWMHTDPDNFRVKFLVWRENEPAFRGVWVKTPLYTAPPQRKPLTEEELDELAMDEDGLPNSHIEFARAVERAHGITP